MDAHCRPSKFSSRFRQNAQSCRLITYWPARSICISGAGQKIRDARRPSSPEGRAARGKPGNVWQVASQNVALTRALRARPQSLVAENYLAALQPRAQRVAGLRGSSASLRFPCFSMFNNKAWGPQASSVRKHLVR